MHQCRLLRVGNPGYNDSGFLLRQLRQQLRNVKLFWNFDMCNVCRIGVCFQECIRENARGSDECHRFPRFNIQWKYATAVFDNSYRLRRDSLRNLSMQGTSNAINCRTARFLREHPEVPFRL